MTDQPRIGVYLRISEDRDGTQTATARQRQDCEGWIDRNGAALADTFEDVDLSAYKRSVTRPEFARMLRAIKAGVLDGVLAWKIDRIARQHRDLVDLFDACEDAHAFLVTLADGIDTRTQGGRLAAEIMVSMARQESENISTRQKRKHEEKAARGDHHGGPRAYGYTAVSPRTVIEAEAAILRECAARLIDGASLASVVNDLNARGIPSTHGRQWQRVSLKAAVSSYHIAGRREHHGELSTGEGWPAILSAEDVARLRALLLDPARAPNRSERHELAGLLRCGQCGNRLIANTRGSPPRAAYRCTKRPNTSACGGVAADRAWLEDIVPRIVAAAIDADVLAEQRRPSPTAGLVEAIAQDEATLRDMASDFANNLITRAEYMTIREIVGRRLEAQRRQLVTPAAAQRPQSSREFLDLFASRDTAGRRALLATFLEHVVIPSVGRGYRLTVDRIIPVWRI